MVSADDLALVQVVDSTDEVCAIATGGAPAVSGALELRFLREGGQSVERHRRRAGRRSSRRRSATSRSRSTTSTSSTSEAAVIARTLQGLRDRGVRVRILDHDEREVQREVPDNVPRPAAPPEYIDSLGLDVRP